MSRLLYLVLAAAVFALPGSSAVAAARSAREHGLTLTHGVVVGDVTTDSAVLWARADREGTLTVHLSGGRHDRTAPLRFRAADDYTGQVVLKGLKPDTTYRYKLGSTRGSFETAPNAGDAERIRLAFGGDVAGQNGCRDANEGFPIMGRIRGSRPALPAGPLRRLGRHDLRRQRLRPSRPLRQRAGARGLRAGHRSPRLLGALALQPGRRRLSAPAREHRLRRRLGRPRGSERLRPPERHPHNAPIHAGRAPPPTR